MNEEPIRINGKRFPLWSQFVRDKEKWIGGILTETCSGPEFPPDLPKPSTKIVDIVLRPLGKDSAEFLVIGEEFECGGDVRFVALDPMKFEDEKFAFAGYGGHEWTIEIPKDEEVRTE